MISGPMTGLPGHNLDAFHEAEQHLVDIGYDVKNPARLGVQPGYEWSDYLRHSLRLLLDCDAIYMLNGWDRSRGAVLELHVASQLGLQVMFENDVMMEPPC